MPAPKNNRYASKPARDRVDDTIQMRCRIADKKRWLKACAARAARDSSISGNISGWIRDTLNAEAVFEESLTQNIK